MKKLPDEISISWHIDDVKQQAETDGYTLTDDEAREVLQMAYYDHDATIGINWDVLSFNINEYKAR